ncbi:TIGR04222 domain-containing membrane protein [Streptomyces sp. WMMC940]|uniref:TIGR04222 domain-containing membrane protein n=1 Tax=Streptomyces sp. WMMC940 TaxID=3015153 RepID=UPI0022B65238|nr:TIGR04222 domain-containing membrane protein [Streptomyces sp. WMMC940]MCZ7457378.1 TIGR04222 domain-containing membrane protein [Streptomyces sp. WMMC940]
MSPNVLAVIVYLAVGVSSALVIRGLARARRGPGGPVHDLMEAAFLNGGPARAVDTALTAMVTDGRLMVGGPGIVAVRRPVAHDHVERAVLDELTRAPSGALHDLRLAVMRNPAVQEIGDGLAARGLMIAPGDVRRWKTWSTWQLVLSLVLLPVSLVATFVQYAFHEGFSDIPFPFVVKVLPACLAGVVVAAVCSSRARRRVGAAGHRAAADYRAAHAHRTDAGHLVAFGGLRAVPDPVLQAQLIAAARLVRTGGGRPSRAGARAGRSGHSGTSDTAAYVPVAVWCAASGGCSGGGGCGGAGGSSCGSGGGCSGGCGGSSGGGSSCGGGSGGGSSCGGGSGGGSSCGGGSGGGSSCGGGST